MLLRLSCTSSEGEPGNRGCQVRRGVRSFRDRCGLLVAMPAAGNAGAIQAARA